MGRNDPTFTISAEDLAEIRTADVASDLANVSNPSAMTDKVVGLVAEWDRGRGRARSR